MDWRQLLGADDGYDLCPGATAGEVAAAEAALGTTFPAQLRGSTWQVTVCSTGQASGLLSGRFRKSWPATARPGRLRKARSATSWSALATMGQALRSAFRVTAAPGSSPGRRSTVRPRC